VSSGDYRVSFRWCAVFLALLAFILVPFFLFASATEAFTGKLLGSGGHLWLLASAGIALLALDVFLPVPSSIVSTIAGGLFGFASGAVVSFIGMTISCALGWYFGLRVGRPSADLMLGTREYDRLQRFFRRYGMFAIVVCRPVPVAAEASIILAGASGAGFARTIAAAGLSNLGISAVYAAVGAYAWTEASFLFAFLGAVLVPLLAMLIYRLIAARTAGN